MKKTIIALALSMLMICSLALSAFASTTTSFSVSPATGGRGETVTLSIVVSSMPEVNSLGIEFGYDNSALEVVSGQWSVSGALLTNFDVSKAKAGAAWLAPTASTGAIFTVTFKVKDNAAFGTTSVTVTLIPTKNGAAALAPAQQVATVTVTCPHTNTENRPEIPAKCNQTGTAAGVYCLGCNTYVSGGTTLPATGLHVDADGKWETSETEHWHTCVCGEILDKASHNGGSATCVAKAQCKDCGIAYGTTDSTKHNVSTEQLAEDKYLVPNTGVNCKDYKQYYYACTDCQNATTSTWISTTLGAHNYGELVQAKVEVHTPDKLEPAVAAHYLCSVCQTYFTEGKVATTLQALTGATPVHTFGDAYKSDAEKHWKECSCGLKNFEGTHVFVGDICSTCTYDRSCQHTKPLTYVSAKPANCTDPGNIEYWYCVDCLAKFDAATAATATKLTDVTVPALDHIFDTKYTYADGYHWNACTGIGCTETTAKVACDSAVKATCQQKAVCDTCGNTYTDFAPHDYATEYTTEAGKHWRACKTVGCTAVTDEANCSGGTATCYKLAVCATCQKEYGTLAAHVISTDWNYKDATGHAHACTNTGCTYHETIQPHVDDAAGESCTVCGHIYHTCGANETTYVAPVIGNCMVKGRQAYYRCSCGKLYYDDAATTVLNSLSDIEAYGAHSGVVTPAVPATCTTPGTTAAMVCSVCRMQFSIAQVIPATGHSFGEWTTTLEPTEYAEGSKSRTCSACNEVETEAIPALGHEHTAVEIPAVAPTCNATGLTAGSKCATCGEILVAQETVPAIDHASVTHVGANAATSTEAGNVEHWICSECETVWLDEERTTVATKEDVVIPVIPETEPEETTQAPEETTAAPEETTQAPEETTAAPEETTQAPEETTAAPEETTEAPEDITVPEETTEAPVETTEAPEETTAAPEETTSPEVPSTGDSAIFFIVALIAFSAIFAFAVALGKKRTEN